MEQEISNFFYEIRPFIKEFSGLSFVLFMAFAYIVAKNNKKETLKSIEEKRHLALGGEHSYDEISSKIKSRRVKSYLYAGVLLLLLTVIYSFELIELPLYLINSTLVQGCMYVLSPLVALLFFRLALDIYLNG